MKHLRFGCSETATTLVRERGSGAIAFVASRLVELQAADPFEEQQAWWHVLSILAAYQSVTRDDGVAVH